MQVNNVNNTNYNPQFRAIFKLRNDGSGIADIITKAVSDCTVKSEANKIHKNFSSVAVRYMFMYLMKIWKSFSRKLILC